MKKAGFVAFILFSVGFSLLLSSCKDDNDTTSYAEDLFNWITWDDNGFDSTIYYISVSGDDGNNGKSINSPFRTMAKAIRNVKSGGKIRVLPGIYSFAIVLEKCNPQAEIVIEGHNGIPVFDGKKTLPGALFFEKCSNLSINGIEFKNYTDFGIGGTYCKKISFTNLILQNNGRKVQLTGWEMEGSGLIINESEEVLIANCEAYQNGPNPQIFPDHMMGSGIDCFKLKNSVVRNNRTHNNTRKDVCIEPAL